MSYKLSTDSQWTISFIIMILMNILLFSLVWPGLLASQILDVPATLEHEHFHEDDHIRGKILPFIGISLPVLKIFSHSKFFSGIHETIECTNYQQEPRPVFLRGPGHSIGKHIYQSHFECSNSLCQISLHLHIPIQ